MVLCPPSAPFFEGRPPLFFPALDGLLVSLVGPTHRLVQAQPQLPNQAADVRRVVEDPELPADHYSYPRARPYLSPKAVSLSSPLQKLGHLGARCSSLRRGAAPGGGLCLKPCTSSLAHLPLWHASSTG